MGDDHEPAGALLDEPAQPLQAISIEMIGGLVEEHHIEPGHRERREAGARGLPPDNVVERSLKERDVEAELCHRSGQPPVDVRPAERQPALEGGRLGADGAQIAAGQRSRPPLNVTVGRLHSDATEDRLADGQASVAVIGELWQVADAARTADRAPVRGLAPGHDPKQSRLAGPVGADEPDPAPRVDAHLDGVEHGAIAVSSCDLASIQQGRRHAPLLPERM